MGIGYTGVSYAGSLTSSAISNRHTNCYKLNIILLQKIECVKRIVEIKFWQ